MPGIGPTLMSTCLCDERQLRKVEGPNVCYFDETDRESSATSANTKRQDNVRVVNVHVTKVERGLLDVIRSDTHLSQIRNRHDRCKDRPIRRGCLRAD